MDDFLESNYSTPCSSTCNETPSEQSQSLKSAPSSQWVEASRTPWKAVLQLAWPVLAQQFLVLLVNLSDAFLAGNYRAVSVEEEIQALNQRSVAVVQATTGTYTLNPVGGVVAAAASQRTADHLMSRQTAIQSAQTTAMYLSWFLNSTTILITVGSTAMVARFIGGGDKGSANRVTNQSMLLAVGFGLVVSVFGLFTIDEIVRLLRLEGASANFAADYLRPLFLWLVFQVIMLAGIACLVGAGDTRSGLWVMSGVAVTNVPLSWGLCLGWGTLPRMGFVGIAMGTALSNTLGGLAILFLLIRGRSGLKILLPLLKPDFSLLRRLLRISLPAAFDSLSLLMGQFWFLSIVNSLGDVASSAHGVAIRWEALGFLSGIAFGTAAMTLVGQNLGAHKPDQAAHSGWTAFGLGCLIMSIMGALFFTLAEPMFHLFFPHPWQQESIIVGVPVLRLIAFAMPALAASIILTNALRGAGDTTFPVLFTWVGFLLVRIPLAYWFSLPEIDLGFLGTLPGWDLGLFGAWLAMFADLILRGGLFTWRFASGAWKKIQV